MSGFNLPPGCWEGDPRAPWNQGPEPCPKCKDDMEWIDEEQVWHCESCDEDFQEYDEEDIEYEKAQASAEWQERHGGGL